MEELRTDDLKMNAFIFVGGAGSDKQWGGVIVTR
jgi:hypothetical protein